jgi:predicted dienelactone hydrolase
VSYDVYLGVPRHDYFIERAGDVVSAQNRTFSDSAGQHAQLRLVSSTGLAVDARILRPADGGERLPVLLLVGGHRTGKDAVERVGRASDIAFAAIDYPYTGEASPDGLWQSLATVPHIQRAFIDTPPALSLVVDWLLEQPWVDPERIELVGASLGVPFAAAAGAVDTRVSRIWLLHGGGDNLSWVAHAGRKHIENTTLRRLAARFALFMVHGASFDTPRMVRESAPRSVILVAAHDDDYVPPEAQAPLIELAKEDHVELIWTEGQHIRSDRDDELQQLLDIVLRRVASAQP